MSDAPFPDETLLQAERRLIGRALLDEGYLHNLLRALHIADDGLPDLRSEDAEVLRRILYVLAAWSSEGTFDKADNELRLIRYGAALGMADGFADYLDDLYSPLMAIEQYQAALIERVLGSQYLQDFATDAVRRLIIESPFPLGTGLEDTVYERLRVLVQERRLRRLTPAASSSRTEREVPAQAPEANADVRFRFDS